MDCTFKTGDKKFNFRVGAVITDGKRLLVTADNHSDWYWVTGGRVKFGETTQAAILREIREELGVNAEIERLYSIDEKFFRIDDTVYHELEFLFLIKPFDISLIDYDAIHCDGNCRLVWLDVDKKPDKPVYPRHVFEAVTNPSAEVKFMVENDL